MELDKAELAIVLELYKMHEKFFKEGAVERADCRISTKHCETMQPEKCVGVQRG